MTQELLPRQFVLNLTDEDMQDFFTLAHSKGTTPTEILQGFICDLVNGSQTRGFDERIYAERYLDRCCYDISPQTFLSWLLEYGRLEEMRDALETRDFAAADIKYYEEHPEDGTPDFIAELLRTREEAERDMEDLFQQYAGGQNMTEGIEGVKAFLAELETVSRH